MELMTGARSRVPTTMETVTALVWCPELYRLGALLPARNAVGRPREHEGWSTVLFGALARHFRSAARAHAEVHSELLWRHLHQEATAAIRALGVDARPPDRPPTWGSWVAARDDHLATDEGLAAVAGIHLEEAADLAHALGLCDPHGKGSWSHPDKTRTAYGDGVRITPMYRPPLAQRVTGPDGSVRILYPDPATGELLETPPRRYDPDAAEHHGKGGPVHATNYVAWHVRGGSYYQRVIVAIGRVPTPGREADTAVAMLPDLRRVFGDGIQAVVYDGAFRGVHIDQVLRRCGYVVICKPITAEPNPDAPAAVRLPGGRSATSYPLGMWEHTVAGGSCRHMLAAVNGAVSEIGLDEAGDPLLLHRLARRQVKRPRRSDGSFHFSVAYEVPCAAERFWVWISPHPTGSGSAAQRAEQVRIVAVTDPDGRRLVGIRSDAESHHYHFKRTLLVGRAMSKGWRRGLLDQYCFALLNNALVAARSSARADGRQATLRALT